MKVLLLSACFVLSACAASVWVNPQHPAADLQADTTACEKDADRVGRLDQLSGPAAAAGCMSGSACVGAAETRRIQVEAAAVAAHRQCMVARGWRQPG